MVIHSVEMRFGKERSMQSPLRFIHFKNQAILNYEYSYVYLFLEDYFATLIENELYSVVW
jgi:hypothetical protein